MVTLFLSIFLFLVIVLRYVLFKKGLISFKDGSITINSGYIVFVIFFLLFIFFQPYAVERIDSGAVGLKENLIGGKRGISSVEFASGLQLYNRYTQKIHEVHTDAKPIDYGDATLIVKGGYGCPMHLTFNVKVKPEAADLLFVETRQTFKNSGLQGVLDTWAKTSIMGSVNHVANRYEPDFIFNNQEKFENEIKAEVNKNLGKFFEVTQMRTNINPPSEMKSIISEKAKTIQETQNAELNAIKAVALNKKKVADAQGDFDAAVLKAKEKDLLSQPKMLELYKAETDRKWAEKGISPWGNNNVFGSPGNILLQRK